MHGERASVAHYERALALLPELHPARSNLIRALLERNLAGDVARALEHAKTALAMQPAVAEMAYQLGVLHMRASHNDEAAASFEHALELDPAHRGALINGVHTLSQLTTADAGEVRRRVAKVAFLGVKAGLWVDPRQRPPHLVAGLRPSQPWHDPADFPMCALLEAHAPDIRREFLEAMRLEHGALTRVGGRSAHDSTLVAKGEWREMPLLGNGEWEQRNCERCPVTTSVLARCPLAIGLGLVGGGESLFSVVRAATHLRPHCGPTNARLTCHLGLVVPNGCSIRCGGETRSWTEGRCIVFDDSFEHEVWNRGAEDRVVLLINFWHPALPPERRTLELDSGGYDIA